MSDLDRYLEVADEAIRFPHSALRIADLASQPESANSQLVSQVEEDPAFAARLLRLVNSSAFPGASGAPIASLDHALVRVGRQKVAELALLQASKSAFSCIESGLLRATTFWEHSQQTAVVARRLASNIGVSENNCYVAGLLHDIGLLLMFHVNAASMAAVLDFSLDENTTLVEAETELLGVSHPVLGAHLADAWNLPSTLASAIGYHHAPWDLNIDELPQEEHSIALCVALANEVSGDPDGRELEESQVVTFARQHLIVEDDDILEIALTGYCEAEALQSAVSVS